MCACIGGNLSIGGNCSVPTVCNVSQLFCLAERNRCRVAAITPLQNVTACTTFATNYIEDWTCVRALCVGVEPACEETMVRTACMLPPATEPPVVTPSIQTAAQVTSIVSAILINPTAVGSLQSSALFAGLYCARPAVKGLSRDVSWTLSPLAAIAFEIGPLPINMTVWNLIFGFCFSAIHFGLMKGVGMVWNQEQVAREKLKYPHMSFTVVVFLYQGTTFGAYKILMLGYYPYYPLAIVTLMVVSFGLPLYVWQWNRANATSLTWTSGHTLPPTESGERLWLIPKGVWGPDDITSQSSVFFNDFCETQRTFKVKQLLFSNAIALTTCIETHSEGACHAQIGVCFALILGMITLYAKDRPMRWPILNYTRILILLTQILQLQMIFFAVEVLAEETVFLVITILCLVDTLAGWTLFARERSLWDLFRSGAKPDTTSNDLLSCLAEAVDDSGGLLSQEMMPSVLSSAEI